MLSPVNRPVRFTSWGDATVPTEQDPGRVLTVKERDLIRDSFRNQLTPAVREARAAIEKANSEVGYIINPFSRLFDMREQINRTLANANQTYASLEEVVRGVHSYGTITNPQSGVARQATAADASNLFRIMSNVAQNFAELAYMAIDYSPKESTKTLLKNIGGRLAGQANTYGDAANNVLLAVAALIEGLKKGAEGVGYILPVAVVGLAVLGVFLVAQTARSRAARYA